MALMETLGLVLGAVFLLYFYLTRNHGYWAKRGVPFEKPILIFGSMLNSMLGKESIGSIMTRIYRKYDGESVVGMFSFMEPTLIVRDPTIAHQILTSDFGNFSHNQMTMDEDADPVMGRNMFFQRGEKWKRTRQALSPGFTLQRVKGNYQKLTTQSDKLVKYIENNPDCEMKSVFSLYTSEVVADWGMGIDAHSFTDKNATLPKLGKMIFAQDIVTMLKTIAFFFLPSFGKIFKIGMTPKLVRDFFDDMLRDLIKQREANPEKRTDLLQYYIDLKNRRQIARNDDQHEIFDEDIIAGIVSFFVEGYETSSIIASFLLQHLANDRALQNRLREEVDQLFTGGELTYEAIMEAPFMHRVWQETLRFYGVEFMNKQCSKSCEIDIGKGKKLFIEEGMSVVIPVQGIQTDPQYWENPQQFNPDRFLGDGQNIQKGTYVPFGDGPRICIGMRMAQASIKTAVAKIIRNFEIVPNEKTSKKYIQDPKHFLTAQLGGYHMTFVKRNLSK